MDIESLITVLTNVPRTGWLIRGVEQPETVADHILGTMFLSMLFEDANPEKESEGMLVMSLIHDIAEVYTGDLTPRTKKYISKANPGTSYIDFETEYFERVMDLLPPKAKDFLMGTWKEFSEKKTERAVRVHIIDVVEMLSQACEYEKTGQRKLDEFWAWVTKCVSDTFLYDLARAIERRRNFLKASAVVEYQHFESCAYHAGVEFANKMFVLDLDRMSKRDEIIGEFFLNSIQKDQSSQSAKYRILDVGCGLGSFSRFFLEQQKVECEVKGVDINPRLLEGAQERWRGKSFEALLPMDIGWYWKLASESFDVVLIGEVLEHVFDPWFVLMESFRVLKPEGLLFISVPNSFHKEKIERYTKEHKIELRFREEHIRYFGAEQIVELLHETGFAIDELWGLDKEWKGSYNLEVQNGPPFPRSEDAWTITVCARRKGVSALMEVGTTPPPGRWGAYIPIKERIEDHKNKKDWAQLHEFIEEMNKTKLLKADFSDRNSETIAQQTFRLAFLACCVAVEMGLDAERIIRCILLQGIIESHLAEISPAIRANFGVDIKKEALKDVTKSLPDRLGHYYLESYEELVLGTKEGLIAEYLLDREFRRSGFNPKHSLDFTSLTNDESFDEIIRTLSGDRQL